jgi:hypothetical protein
MNKGNLSIIHYACLASLLHMAPFTTFADQAITKTLDKSNQSTTVLEIDINNLATEAVLDTKDKFEAILFDQQSQITYGKLDWDKNRAEGRITFEVNGKTEQTGLHISDIEALNLSDQYSTLLNGLHEAGIAHFSLSQNSTDTIEVDSKVKEPMLISPMARLPTIPATGEFESVTPKHLSNPHNNPIWPESGITRHAHGWAYDPDRPSESVWIHFYGIRRSSNDLEFIGSVLANKSRPDINQRYGISGSHGWSTVVPESWDIDGVHDLDGTCFDLPVQMTIDVQCSVRFHAYAIDRTGDGNTRLRNSPYLITATKYQW